MVVMYPYVVGGMDCQEIAALTGLPAAEVELYAGRLRENGIWTPENKISVSWDDPESPEAFFECILQVLCATGCLERRTVEQEQPTTG